MTRRESCAWCRKADRVSAFIAACVILGAAALSGCVQTPTRSRIAPSGNDGGVLLKISDNLPINAATSFWGDAVTVRHIPDAADPSSTCYGLHRGMRGEVASTWLGAALPPGTYEFPTIGATKDSIGECNQRELLATNRSQFGKFTVSTGRLTYLGVLERTGANELMKSYMIPMSTSEHGDLDEILREEFPGLSKLDTREPQGWVAGSLPQGQSSARNYALFNAYGLFDPSQAPDGTWLFGTRTGIVRTWSRGQPRTLRHDTGHRVALVATAVLPDASWLVAGEESTLLRSIDQGRSWYPVRGDLPFGLIEHIAPVGQELVLTLIDGKSVSIYRGDIQSMHWKKVASYQTEFAFWTGVRGIEPHSFLVGSAYVTTLPSRQMAVYDVSTGASEVRSMPGSIAHFAAGDDGVLRCKCAATIVFNPYESHDLGKTWESSAFSRWMALPGMTDATHGVTWYKTGLFDKPTMAYTMDGRTWQRSLGAPAGLVHFFHSRDGKIVYASNEADLLWVSQDGGKRWDSALFVPLPVGDTTYP